MSEARVWVGCLGCYNAGGLVGAWVDAIDAEDLEPHAYVLEGTGSTIPPCGRLEGADERWVFDFEGFAGMLSGECSPAEAAQLAEVLEAVEADGLEVEAFGAYVANIGRQYAAEDWASTREQFAEAYRGRHASGADYAEELFEELGGFEVYGPAGGSDRTRDLSSSWPFYCIDWDRAWRELELGDGYWVHDAGPGEVYVFAPA